MIKFARQVALVFMLTMLFVGVLPSQSQAAIKDNYFSVELQTDSGKLTPSADTDSPDDCIPVSLQLPSAERPLVETYQAQPSYLSKSRLYYQSRAPPFFTH